MKRTAYYEAGHAVVAIGLRRPIHYVTIIPEHDSHGHLSKIKTPKSIRPDIFLDARTVRWVEREILICFAGTVAEGHFVGRQNDDGVSIDYREAVELASMLVGGDVLEKYLAYMLAKARAYVTFPLRWVQIEALATELLKHRHVMAKRAREVCRRAISGKLHHAGGDKAT